MHVYSILKDQYHNEISQFVKANLEGTWRIFLASRSKDFYRIYKNLTNYARTQTENI